jgi:hypothetical protein
LTGFRPAALANCHTITEPKGKPAMLGARVLRSALTAFSITFGSLGVFFVYLSFLQPSFAMHAVLCLGAAMGILRSAPQE